MIINNFFLHHIDVNSNSVTPINLQLNPQNLNDYVEELLNEIIANPNRRTYSFKDGNTEVKASLSKILENNSDIENITELNAKRLLEKEINAQEWMRSRNMPKEIQKGSLLQTKLCYQLKFNLPEILNSLLERWGLVSQFQHRWGYLLGKAMLENKRGEKNYKNFYAKKVLKIHILYI